MLWYEIICSRETWSIVIRGMWVLSALNKQCETKIIHIRCVSVKHTVKIATIQTRNSAVGLVNQRLWVYNNPYCGGSGSDALTMLYNMGITSDKSVCKSVVPVLSDAGHTEDVCSKWTKWSCATYGCKVVCSLSVLAYKRVCKANECMACWFKWFWRRSACNSL